MDPSQPSPQPRKKRFAWLLQAPGKRSHWIALLAFILFALSLTTPAGPFWLPDPAEELGIGPLALPYILFGYLLWGGMTLKGCFIVLLLVLESPPSIGMSWVTDVFLYLVPLWLWYLVSVNWLIKGIAHGIAKLLGNPAMKQVRPRRYWVRWAIAPALVLVLHGLWMTQLPMRAAFALNKPSLEKIADQAIAAKSGEVIFEQPTRLGLASAFAAYRLPLSSESKAAEPSEQAQYDKKAAENSVTSILLKAQWGYTGYVRDLSRKPGDITKTLFALTPYKVNDDLDEPYDSRVQSLYYLGDGWYSYQVQRDDYLPEI